MRCKTVIFEIESVDHRCMTLAGQRIVGDKNDSRRFANRRLLGVKPRKGKTCQPMMVRWRQIGLCRRKYVQVPEESKIRINTHGFPPTLLVYSKRMLLLPSLYSASSRRPLPNNSFSCSRTSLLSSFLSRYHRCHSSSISR